MERYLDVLSGDEKELDHLAADLLINVTSFFRDPGVFERAGEEDHSRSGPQPFGRSAAAHLDRRMQHGRGNLFSGHAVPRGNHRGEAGDQAADLRLRRRCRCGRDGPGGPLSRKRSRQRCPPERLARFFSKDDHGYRILPELRATIVFAVQDVLADPPFSRLDLVSCRNLLIYLRPEAQEKVISFFHFALREGGILLLGSAETIGSAKGRFEVISKAERLYRHIGRSRPGEVGLLVRSRRRRAAAGRVPQGQTPSRQAALAEGCRRLVMETYAPAAVLINRKLEWLYSLGPTERYLRVPQGHPSYDLLAMVRPHLRIKLRAAIHQAMLEKARIRHPGRPDEPRRQARFVRDRGPTGSDRRRRPAAGLLHRRSGAGRQAKPARLHAPDTEHVAELEQQLRSDAKRNFKPRSTASKPQTRSKRRSTKRRCPSTRNINRPTKSC